VRFLLNCTCLLGVVCVWSNLPAFESELADGWEGRDKRRESRRDLCRQRHSCAKRLGLGQQSPRDTGLASVADRGSVDCRRDCFEISV